MQPTPHTETEHEQELTEHEQELLKMVELNAPEWHMIWAEALYPGWEYIRTDVCGLTYLLVTMYSDGYFCQRRIDLAAARGAN